MVKSKKQGIFHKLNSSGGGDSDIAAAQPRTEIFNLPAITTVGAVSSRSHPFADPACNLGLHYIVRKAPMGSFNDKVEDNGVVMPHPVGFMPGSASTSVMTSSYTWNDEGGLLPHSGVCKPKLINKSNIRKSKPPIPGQSYLVLKGFLLSSLYIQRVFTTGRHQDGPGKTGPLQQVLLSSLTTL